MAQIDTDRNHSLFLHEQLAHLHTGKTQMKVSNIASDEDIMENIHMFVILWNLSTISHLIFPQCFFSSPEHIVLRVSYCDRSLSGVRTSLCPSVREQLLKNSSPLKPPNRFQ